MARQDYEKGFEDALDMVEQKLFDYKMWDILEKIKPVLEEIRSSIREKKIERLKYELGIT